MSESTRPFLAERFRRHIPASGDRPAVHLPDRVITYEQAHETALLWAGSLRSQVPSLESVGVFAGKGVESYIGILAALYAGATVVPLNPELPALRTRRMVEMSGVSAVLVDQPGLAMLGNVLEHGAETAVFAPGRESETPEDFHSVAEDRRSALDEPHAAGSDIAYMLFTSGSTGRPKGVPITHANTEHYFGVLDKRYDFVPADVFSQTFDLTFDCAMFDLYCAWGAGASVAYIPGHAYRDLPAFFAEHGITVWFSTPSAITLARRMGALGSGSMPSLRWSFFAGEALRVDDAAQWQSAAPGSTVENLYGPTELTVTVTGHRWSPTTSPAKSRNGLAPIGAVNEGHDAVLIGEDGEASEDEGELCITGPQMTPGYLAEEDNEGRFLNRDSRWWYRTGDRVRRLSDGELVYLGRLDSQVQVQGWRVELPEIEHAVRSCTGVTDAVVVARSLESGTDLVVFYTGERVAPVEFHRRLREILPVGIVPKQYEHVEEFPLNANRKVDRSELAAQAREMAGTKNR